MDLFNLCYLNSLIHFCIGVPLAWAGIFVIRDCLFVNDNEEVHP
jgi:hypothetical protein